MSTPPLDAVRHRIVNANGIRIHVAEQGAADAPLVLMVHGFPESWYSWRYQLPALADAGYHAAAIDVRGYGRSSKPVAIDAYRMVQHVADNVDVARALGHDTAIVVGHDWGSPIACNSCLLRPDVFTALAHLSVPYSPRGTTPPSAGFRLLGGDEEFYIEYFQEPGRAEAEIEADVRAWLLGFYFSASGDAPSTRGEGSIASVPRGGKLSDRFAMPDKMPDWLTDEDLDFYTSEFEHTGFTGPLNRYRNMQRDWEDLAAFTHQPIVVPSLFIGGSRDGPTVWGGGAIGRFDQNLPALRGSHVLDGCGHWVQQERADTVNATLLEFLSGL